MEDNCIQLNLFKHVFCTCIIMITTHICTACTHRIVSDKKRSVHMFHNNKSLKKIRWNLRQIFGNRRTLSDGLVRFTWFLLLSFYVSKGPNPIIIIEYLSNTRSNTCFLLYNNYMSRKAASFWRRMWFDTLPSPVCSNVSSSVHVVVWTGVYQRNAENKQPTQIGFKFSIGRIFHLRYTVCPGFRC